MKRLVWLLVSVFFLPLQGQPLEKTLLWKISGNGINKPSYLFGTIHATCDTIVAKKVREALSETASLYLETDLQDPSLIAEVMAGMLLPDGTTLSSMLADADAQVLDAYLQKELGMGLPMVDRVKPFFLSALLVKNYLGDCHTTSVEELLMPLARADGKPIRSLETVKEQLDAAHAIPDDEMARELLTTAKADPSVEKKAFDEVLALYRKQDVDALAASEEGSVTANHTDALLNSRNRKWVPKIIAQSQQNPAFFAVGAGHLGGENGLIRLLRKAGLKVKPVL